MNKVLKRITGVILSVVFLCCICSTGLLGMLEAEAALASEISLDGISLSRAAKTDIFTQKLGSNEYDYEYEYDYYTYSASWDSLSLSGVTNFAQNMSTEHPRLLFRDFAPVLALIESDFNAMNFYRNVKSSADTLLNKEPCAYYLNIRNNINDFSSTIETRLMQLSFVYNIEKLKTEAGVLGAETDYVKYAERAVLEMQNAADYKHWSVNAFLCTAEIASGFAFAYDWLYDYLTLPENAEALAMVRDGVYNHAIVPFLYNYIVEKTGTNFVTTLSNWNCVCNGSAIIIGLSFYEPTDTTGKFSTICNYLFERGAEALWAGLEEYEEGGFYREGLSYWGYATEYMTRAVATYEGLVPDDYSMPQRFTHILSKGVDVTGYYPVYMNGITEAFNFGDCSKGFTLDTALLFLAERFNKPELASYLLNFHSLYGTEISGRDAVYALAWFKPDAISADTLSKLPLDKFHASDKDVNILSMRSSFAVNKLHRDNAYVAMQGGKNLANHMGYSMGTFVLDMNGKRFVKSHGSGNYAWSGYNGGAASKAQYYIRRAEGYNTIIVDPTYSPDTGEKLADGEVCGDQSINGFATFSDSGTSDNVAYGIMDLASTNVRLKTWNRGIMLADDRSRVIVQDEIAAADSVGTIGDVYWFAHIGNVDCVISEDGKTATLTNGKVSINAKITRGPGTFELVDAKPLATSPNPEVQQSVDYGKKLQIHLINIKSAINTVEFAPAEVTDNLAYTKLSDWSTLLSDDEESEEEVVIRDNYINTNNFETDWYKDSYQTYFIHDDKDLAGLAYLVNNGNSFEGKTVKLVNDITMSSALDWVPIGTRTNQFKGNFDGSQKTISGLCFNDIMQSQVGLFGAVKDASIKNFLLTDVSIHAHSDVGAVVGAVENSTIINVFVYNAAIWAQSRVGGIVGMMYSGNVLNSGVSSKIYGQSMYYGGIAGYVCGVVDNCAAIVSLCEETEMVVTDASTGATAEYGVNIGSHYGGIVGVSNYGDVRNSYYNYVKKYNGNGIQPLGSDSVNLSNTLGKTASNLNVSNIGGTNSVLGYTGNGNHLTTVMNCWIDAQEDKEQYLTWKTVSGGVVGNYSMPNFVPEEVVDENNNKELFEISDVIVADGKVSFNVSNVRYGDNTGYLVVVQTNSSGTKNTKITALDMNSRATLPQSIDATTDVENVHIFVLDSFITMKIKSNIVNL